MASECREMTVSEAEGESARESGREAQSERSLAEEWKQEQRGLEAEERSGFTATVSPLSCQSGR